MRYLIKTLLTAVAILFGAMPANADLGDQLFKLLPKDGAAVDIFGFSIAIDNGIVAVGAIYDDDNGSYSGSAYLFDASTGAQLAKLLPADGAAGDEFGRPVSISGDTAVIGASWDDDNGYTSGSAYVFDLGCGDCPVDCNDDGIVNIVDFLCFLNYYNASDPAADCNDDGIVNTLDFLCFLNAYNEGC